MTVLRDFTDRWWNLSLDAQVYIETGVGLGDSFACAVRQPFDRLHGIDVSERAVAACLKFAADPRVAIHHGSSLDVLPRIIDPTKKTLFWLDAHYEGPDCWQPEHGQCPLLAELRIILAVRWEQKPVILIDDYSAFMSYSEWWRRYAGERLDREQWPTFAEIYDEMGGVDYRWTFLTGTDGILYCW
jgi:hypothetical protein